MPSAKDVQIQSENLKAFVVGDSGTGKSVFASTFPKPAFLFDFDKGILTYRGLDVDYEQFDLNPQGWTRFETTFRQVEQAVKEGKYKTVILDSTTTFTDLAMERALSLDPKRSSTNGPLWNVHYQMVKNLVEGYLRRFVSLNCNLVVIAHFQIVTDQESGNVIAIEPLLTGQLSGKVPGLFDEVYCAFTKMESGNLKYILRTTPKGFYKARSRLSGKVKLLPDEIENDYDSVISCIKEGKSHTKTFLPPTTKPTPTPIKK